MKPKSVEIYPVYICDACGSRHCETIDYVKKIGKILCGCGTVLDLTPIETFKVSPVFKEVLKKTKTKKTPPVTLEVKEDSEIEEESQEGMFSFLDQGKSNTEGHIDKECSDESVELLVSLGWKKGEAAKKVKDVSLEWVKEKGKSINRDTATEFAQFLMFQN
jgi:hypothetical protein